MTRIDKAESTADFPAFSPNGPSPFSSILESQPVNRILEQRIRLKLRNEDTVLAFMGSLAVIIGFVEEDRFFTENYKGNLLCDVMRMLLMVLSVVSCIMVVRRYLTLVALLKVKKRLSKDDNILSSGLFRAMLGEIFINFVHCPPGLDTTFEVEMLQFTVIYSVDSIFTLALLLRLYLVVRLFSAYSKFMEPRAEMILRWHGMETTTKFAVKGFIYEHPLLSVVCIFTSLSVLWSMIVLLLEQPARHYDNEYAEQRGYESVTESSLNSFSSCLWMVFVTTTTGNL